VKTLHHFDPDRLHSELRDLLSSRTLSGEINVASGVEPDFGATLHLERGCGEFRVSITSQFGLQDGAATVAISTDQTFLHETLRELDAAPVSHPVGLTRLAEVGLSGDAEGERSAGEVPQA
jgi:hypothetical protein